MQVAKKQCEQRGKKKITGLQSDDVVKRDPKRENGEH